MKEILQNDIVEASKILKDGGLIAFPTETVFGLGVVFDNKEAYDRLVSVKRRPPDKPFTIMCSDKAQIDNFAILNDKSKILIDKFMPGQFTLITEAKKGLPSWCVSKENTVGIRIPDSDFVRLMIRKCGKPLLVPSANKSGEEPANTSEEVKLIFSNEIDAVVNGESISKKPSTIVLVNNDNIKVIREGIITSKEILEALK